MMRAVQAVRDKKLDLVKDSKNVQCTKSNAERNWHDFSQLSVCGVSISSQRIKEERNGCAALNVANCAIRSVQATVKTGLSSPATTISTASVNYMAFLSNFSFQFGQACYYIHMFSIQTISFFLYYEVSLIFLFYAFSPRYVTFPLYYNETYLKMLEKFCSATSVTTTITFEVLSEVGDTGRPRFLISPRHSFL
jgi:hypothetical protein